MTKRRWVALIVLLAVSVALGRGGAVERSAPDLTGTWCFCLRGYMADVAGGQEFFQIRTHLYIDQYDGFAYFLIPELGLCLDGFVGHRYVVASEGWMGYDYGYCTILDARLGSSLRSFKGNMRLFDMDGGDDLNGNGSGGALFGYIQFRAQKLSSVGPEM
jgi:hypothetical protein